MKFVTFLLIAVVIMAVCLGGIGGWLMPQLGVGGMLAQAVGGAIGGGLIAVIYQRSFRNPAG